jgi:hypothetical protein
VEAFSASLGKILPIGKFGKSSSLKAALWNFHPAAMTITGNCLTDWKKNSKYDRMCIFGFGLDSKVCSTFWRIAAKLKIAGKINLAVKACEAVC